MSLQGCVVDSANGGMGSHMQACAVPPKKGEPLNTHIPWWGPARPAVDVSGDLRGKILGLYDAHLSADGKKVDYEALAKDPLFGQYADATAELQKVDLFQMGREGAPQLSCFLRPVCQASSANESSSKP